MAEDRGTSIDRMCHRQARAAAVAGLSTTAVHGKLPDEFSTIPAGVAIIAERRATSFDRAMEDVHQ